MKFDLLGICFDRTQTLRKGASKAPAAIRKVFPKLETYVSGVDLSQFFLRDLGNIKPKSLEDLENRLDKIDFHSVPIVLGGEHSVSYAIIKKLKPEVVVHVDAHPDLEDKDNHTGVLRKIGKEVGYENIILYGVRTTSKNEASFIKENRIKSANLEDLRRIKKRVYLTIDFDVLDPSVLSAVGNPEPDGLKFKDVVDVVKALAKNLIGIDFVEFTPDKNYVNNIIAGKLIYSCLAEIIKTQQVLP
jgi:agmatinase